jgi:hypothetical protein
MTTNQFYTLNSDNLHKLSLQKLFDNNNSNKKQSLSGKRSRYEYEFKEEFKLIEPFINDVNFKNLSLNNIRNMFVLGSLKKKNIKGPPPPNYFKNKLQEKQLKKKLDELHKKTTKELEEIRFNSENEILKKKLLKEKSEIKLKHAKELKENKEKIKEKERNLIPKEKKKFTKNANKRRQRPSANYRHTMKLEAMKKINKKKINQSFKLWNNIKQINKNILRKYFNLHIDEDEDEDEEIYEKLKQYYKKINWNIEILKTDYKKLLDKQKNYENLKKKSIKKPTLFKRFLTIDVKNKLKQEGYKPICKKHYIIKNGAMKGTFLLYKNK